MPQTATAVVSADEQAQCADAQYAQPVETVQLTGKDVLDQHEEVQRLPLGLRRIIYKHSKAVTPAVMEDKHYFQGEVIPIVLLTCATIQTCVHYYTQR